MKKRMGIAIDTPRRLVVFSVVLAFGLPSSVNAATITVPDDQATIQAAVNAASLGDTVLVKAGTYFENVVITKALTLQGEDRHTTEINAGGTGNVIYYVHVNDVTITGFKITNGEYGIYASQSDRSNIQDCEIFGNDRGVRTTWGSYTVVSNNQVHDNALGAGIWLDSMRNSIVEHNTVASGLAGIYVGFAAYDNIVRNNIVKNNSYYGIRVGSDYAITGNRVFHNDVYENSHQAEDNNGVTMWDDGYPSGGNYWGDYTGLDEDSDGIGDTPYEIRDSGGNLRAYDYYPLMVSLWAPDVDDDGLRDDFEAGFGGNPPEESIEVVNPEAAPPDSASATGSAAVGSTITTGLLTLDFPAGTSVASGWMRIEATMLPGGTGNCGGALEHCVEITGADLGGGTKTVTMPIDTAARVCIEDKTGAEIQTACENGEKITIPAPGDSVNVMVDGSDVTITTGTAGTSIIIEGLRHTALVTFADADLDGVPDQDDACPFALGLPALQGCPPEIDIRPWSETNPINPFSRGVVPVAILGSQAFDVGDVDATTLAFGPDGAAPVHAVGGHVQDVNDDGFMDLLSHFRTEETGIAVGDTEACVTGETVDGVPWESCDRINTQSPSHCGLGFELALLAPPLMWLYGRRRRRMQ